MRDLFLQLERDEDVQEILGTLTDTQRDALLKEMKEISDNLDRSLKSLRSRLTDEEAVTKFIDTLGKAIGMSNLNDNLGTETISWPEKR
tara:strand:- start:247 stop:513 length:267 start_codon:yes stop_codon:yes gene_type:complete